MSRDGALGIVAIVLVMFMRLVQPRWSFVGAQLFVAVTVAATCYLIYAALQTFLRRAADRSGPRFDRPARPRDPRAGAVGVVHLRDLRRALTT